MAIDTSFTLDRDLLAHCPTLLRDGGAAARVVLDDPNATVSSGRVVVADSLTTAGVEAGSILTIGGVAYEVTSGFNANQCYVALPMASGLSSIVRPSDATALHAVFYDFSLIRLQAVRDVLRHVGIDPADPDASAKRDAVLNSGLLRDLEVLRALSLIFATADATSGLAMHPYLADLYAKRFGDLAANPVLRCDEDGDAQADSTVQNMHISTSRL